MSKKATTVSIAIAEDHPTFRRGIRSVLEQTVFSIDLEATDGEDLIAQLSQREELPSICILDISMPRMDGYETLKVLKQHWPQIKVLVMSFYDHEFSIIRMIRGGAVGYLLKDSNPEEIIEALGAIHRHGFYHSAFMSQNLYRVLYNGENLQLHFSEKELELLTGFCSDLSYAEIAERLNLSPRTVEAHRDKLFTKIQVKNRAGLILFVLQTGILPMTKHCWGETPTKRC